MPFKNAGISGRGSRSSAKPEREDADEDKQKEEDARGDEEVLA
jgi:hypothetical protein